MVSNSKKKKERKEKKREEEQKTPEREWNVKQEKEKKKNEEKRALRNTVIVPTLTYASETWVWNEGQRSGVQAVEMSYLRSACRVSRMDGMSNESVYEHFRNVSCG